MSISLYIYICIYFRVYLMYFKESHRTRGSWYTRRVECQSFDMSCLIFVRSIFDDWLLIRGVLVLDSWCLVFELWFLIRPLTECTLVTPERTLVTLVSQERIPCILQKFHAYRRNSLHSMRIPWIPQEFSDFRRNSMHSAGIPWIPLEFLPLRRNAMHLRHWIIWLLKYLIR